MSGSLLTQKTVDAAIDNLLVIADHFEQLRDGSRFESTAYWEWHGKAMSVILSAENLMPGQGGAFD